MLASAGCFVIPNNQIFVVFPCHVASNIKMLYVKKQEIAKHMNIAMQLEGEMVQEVR